MYQVIYRKTAAKALLKMPLRVAEQFKEAFEQMAMNDEDGLDIKNWKVEKALDYGLAVTVRFTAN